MLSATSEDKRDPVWGSRLWSDASVAVSETPDPNAPRTTDHESAGDQSATVSVEPRVVVPPANGDAAAKAPVTTGTAGQAPAPAATGSGKVHIHVVQKNETFSSIATSVYGSPTFYPYLLRANPKVDPAKLKPGMQINVPDAADVKPPEKPAASDATTDKPTPLIATTATHRTEAAPVDAKSEYRVQSGDSLHKIAVKLYGKIDMVDKIYQLNKSAIGDNPAKLKLGMVLKLPEPPVAK
jgi:nucleoid-associated protein YgaU